MHACAIQGESTGVLHGEEVGWFPTLRRWFVGLGFFCGGGGGVKKRKRMNLQRFHLLEF